MAQRQYDVANGGDMEVDVVVSAGSSIGSSAVRVTVDDANASNKLAVIKALEATIRRINKGTWPPT